MENRSQDRLGSMSQGEAHCLERCGTYENMAIDYSSDNCMYWIEDLCRQDECRGGCSSTIYRDDPEASRGWGSGKKIPYIRYIKVLRWSIDYRTQLVRCMDCESSSCPHASFIYTLDHHRHLERPALYEEAVKELTKKYSRESKESMEKFHEKSAKEREAWWRSRLDQKLKIAFEKDMENLQKEEEKVSIEKEKKKGNEKENSDDPSEMEEELSRPIKKRKKSGKKK